MEQSDGRAAREPVCGGVSTCAYRGIMMDDRSYAAGASR